MPMLTAQNRHRVAEAERSINQLLIPIETTGWQQSAKPYIAIGMSALRTAMNSRALISMTKITFPEQKTLQLILMEELCALLE
jgi:hypothetical protein